MRLFSSYQRLVFIVLVCAGPTARLRAQHEAPLGTARINLSHITDRTDLAFEESPAYYALLAEARDVPLSRLQTEAARLQRKRWEESPQFRKFPINDYPLFYDLTQHPQDYRGQPVTMQGHLVRLVKYAAGSNDFGIDTLYEGWLVTPDSETHPATIICTEIPEGMPIGEELIDGVSVTGYFFKLHTYSSRDRKVRFAPMILAHTLTWSPPNEAAGWPVSTTQMVVGILLLSGVSVVMALIAARRSRRFKQSRYRDAVPETPPEFLNDLTP